MNDESRHLLDELQRLQQVLDSNNSDDAGDFGADDIPLLDDVLDADIADIADSELQPSEPLAKAPVISLNRGQPASIEAARPAEPVQEQAKQAPAKPEAVKPEATKSEPSQPLSAADLLGLGEGSSGPDIIDMLDQMDDGATDQAAGIGRQGGNPFLPASILERLATERAAAEADAQQANVTLSSHQRRHTQREPSPNHDLLSDIPRLSEQQKQALLDDLVEEMLPTLRYKLRQRLKDLLYS
ncbi:hypothetical protein GCM10011297_04620 [Bacterioplanes sanyensis]|uniref:hypothetical protein n=1 Tax=Bacterioplanes sanyensis TaxID=1249553 RepID=UPI001679E65B|nr:hypothetical protein [Bacterioplanes sanyensis]GGY34635.1 hypothetical protein GCM10011297_04620 [Bacterioplanes sanyensis]